MNELTILCPFCGKGLLWSLEQRGRSGICPHCRNMFTYPRTLPGMPNEAELRAQDERSQKHAHEGRQRFIARVHEEEKERYAKPCPACGTQVEPYWEGKYWCSRCTRQFGEHAEDIPSLVGKTLRQKFRVVGDSGEGGFGRVYKAEDGDLRGQLVAIKELKLNDPESLIDEARVLSQLRHPNIVGFRELFRESEGDKWYMVMDFVDGMSLEDMIQSRLLYTGSTDEVYARILSFAVQSAEGLSYAHQHEERVIHQDVKPHNMLVSKSGTMKVSDFGLAKARPVRNIQDGAYQYAVAGNGIMSQHYCSPEQRRGEKLTTKTDTWSWGVSCLEMFTGGVSWEFGILAERALADYLKSTQKRSSIPRMPEALTDLLRKCFSRDPQNRPGMQDVLAMLAAVQRGETGNWFARLFK